MPDWYLTGRAARYWGVPPWVMEDAPIKWTWRALTAEHAESKAEAAARKRAERRR